SVRFGIGGHAVRAAQRGKFAVVVVRDEVRLRSPHVPEKPLGYFPTADHATRHRRHVPAEVVASAALELLREGWRPVLHANFVAVDEGADECLVGKRPEGVEERAKVLVEM